MIAATVNVDGFVQVNSGQASASANGFAEVIAQTSDGTQVLGLHAILENCARKTDLNTKSVGLQIAVIGGSYDFQWFTGAGNTTKVDSDGGLAQGGAEWFQRKHRVKFDCAVYASAAGNEGDSGSADSHTQGSAESTLSLTP